MTRSHSLTLRLTRKLTRQLSSPPSQTITRGRTPLRQNHSHTHYICARSTSRNIFCSYCHLKGNHISMCNVHLDSRGHNAFDPKEFCSFHNRTGHTLQSCRHYNCLYSSSGNDQRYSLTNLPYIIHSFSKHHLPVCQKPHHGDGRVHFT